MAQERRFQQERFQDYDRPENRQDWEYGRGRENRPGMSRGYADEETRQSFYGRGRESPYSESYGWGRDYGEWPGDPWTRTGRSYTSESYGPTERYGRGYDWSRGRRGYAGGWRGGEERGFWDRASDEVSSWFGDDEAERRRRMDQFRGRGPKNYTRSQDRIREDVCDRLTDDWSVDASDIDVKVSGSEVTLSGTVADREQRRRAEDCAERVSGVSHVQNNIRVKDQRQETTKAM